jgi:cathepsin D
MSYNFFSKYFEADGILGLGFKSISAFHADPFVETVIGQGRLQESVFGLSLAQPNSMLILGGRDSNLYKGNLTYLVVDTPVRISRGVPRLYFNADAIQGYWQTKLDGIAVNGNGVQVSNKDVIIDSGITAVVGDHDSIANFYGNIPDSSTADGLTWTCTFVTEFIVRVAS